MKIIDSLEGTWRIFSFIMQDIFWIVTVLGKKRDHSKQLSQFMQALDTTFLPLQERSCITTLNSLGNQIITFLKFKHASK